MPLCLRNGMHPHFRDAIAVARDRNTQKKDRECNIHDFSQPYEHARSTLHLGVPALKAMEVVVATFRCFNTPEGMPSFALVEHAQAICPCSSFLHQQARQLRKPRSVTMTSRRHAGKPISHSLDPSQVRNTHTGFYPLTSATMRRL